MIHECRQRLVLYLLRGAKARIVFGMKLLVLLVATLDIAKREDDQLCLPWAPGPGSVK